jgi:DNA-binding XRE family transcriptional regulator|nr:MAG TPA: Repressor protein CI [Caudoviricetes sp.]
MSDSKLIFSKNLKTLLEKKNLSQVELSKILGVSESSVGKWLLQKSMPRMTIIEKLAQYFQVDKTYFFKDTNNELPELTEKNNIDFPQIKAIQRAMTNVDEEKRNRMLEVLKISFQEAFEEDDDD